MNNHKGFTIVELLIVIVIIGILSSLVITAYNGIQDRAKYSRTLDSMRKVEKAFKLKAIADGQYQQDTYYLTCMGYDPVAYVATYNSNNVIISDVIAECNDTNPLSNFLNPDDYVDVGVPLYYDNDLDTYPTTCSAFSTAGVNLYFGGNALDTATLTSLDKDVDSANGLTCGIIRTSGATGSGQQYYMIATSSSDGI